MYQKLSKNYNTYHPHFHVILMVNKSYFNDSNYYIILDNALANRRLVAFGGELNLQKDLKAIRSDLSKYDDIEVSF